MKKSFKFACFVTFMISCSFSVYAQKVTDVISEELYQQLKTEGSLQNIYFKEKDYSLKLVPDNELARKAAEYWNDKNGEPVFICENLYLKTKEELLGNSGITDSFGFAARSVRSVSEMTGMTYLPKKDKKREVLYKEAYCIKSPDDKTKVLDDLSGNIDGKVLYAYLNDTTYGKTYYKLEYFQQDSTLFAAFTNVSPIYAGPIKAVESDNLRSIFVYMEYGDEVLVYLITKAKFPAVKMLENTINDAFSARLIAVYDWFIERYIN